MKIIAHCVGGFANMVNTLVTATFISKSLSIPLYINWFKTDQCDCDLHDIFTFYGIDIHMYSGEDTGDKIVKLWRPIRDSYKDQLDLKVHNEEKCINMFECKTAYELVNKIRIEDPDTVYISDVIVPSFIPYTHFFTTFRFRKELISRIPADIVNTVDIGLHIRGTDTLSKYDDPYDTVKLCIEGLLKDHKKMFVSTDDDQITEVCKAFSNVVTNKNRHSVVKKNVNRDWINLGKEGFNNIFNVYRERNQVIEGIVDLLTLASMPKIKGFITSRESTYYDLAFKIQMHKAIVFGTKMHTVKLL